MRNINRVMKNSKVIGNNWRQELDTFLSVYRATPHDSTGISPSHLMFKTKSSSANLPVIFDKNYHFNDLEKIARDNELQAKANMKFYMDKKLNVSHHGFQIGDKVFVKQKLINKSTPRYDPLPFKIVEVLGSKISAQRGDDIIVRNCSFFRKCHEEFYDDDKLKPIPIIEIHNQIIPTVSNSCFAECSSNSDELKSVENRSIVLDDSSLVVQEEIQFPDGHEIFNSEGEIKESDVVNGEVAINEVDTGEAVVNSEVTLGRRQRRAPERYSDTDENERMRRLRERERENALEEKTELLRIIYSS